MRRPPRFAVLVPVWNGARFVGQAIDSVRAQTLSDWDLVVVDDGSEDESARAAARRGARVVRLPRNGGVLAARRAGLQATRSEAVVFLDGDDRLRPKALERFADALDRHPEASGVYGDRVLIEEDGRTFGSERGALLAARPSGDVLAVLLRRNFLSTPAQMCARRAALPPVETWDVGIRRMADWYLWCRLATSGGFQYIGRGPVVEYRLRRGSMARSLAAEDGGRTNIDELRPALDAVFSLPEIVERFTPDELRRLRRQAEASAYAWKGQELLRGGDLARSRVYLRAALRSEPFSVVDLMTLVLAMLPRTPEAVRPWVGTLRR